MYWSNTIQWNIENEKLVEDFASLMIEMWRIHPFRDGNTRMTSVFMNFFAEKNKIEFNGEIFSQHPGYLRKALVLAAVEEAPETEYLLKMLKDVLSLRDVKNIVNQEGFHEKYQMIKQYKVTEYKQTPFETDIE